MPQNLQQQLQQLRAPRGARDADIQTITISSDARGRGRGRALLREQFEVLHRRAVSDGRFHLTDPRTARTLTFGAFRMAIRDLYLGEVSRDHAHHLVVMLLTAFGLSREEAIAISQSQDVTAASGSGHRATSH